MSHLQAQPHVRSVRQKTWVLLGIGLGAFMSTLDVGIINVALPTLVHLGVASGLLSLSRTSGVTVGVSIFGAISMQAAQGSDVALAPIAAVVAGFQASFHVAAVILTGAGDRISRSASQHEARSLGIPHFC